MPLVTQEIASLQAQLAQQRQEYARRPRIHRLTSMATRASVDAAYLHEWSTRVEQTGNRHYPQEALQRRITGSLRSEERRVGKGCRPRWGRGWVAREKSACNAATGGGTG